MMFAFVLIFLQVAVVLNVQMREPFRHNDLRQFQNLLDKGAINNSTWLYHSCKNLFQILLNKLKCWWKTSKIIKARFQTSER